MSAPITVSEVREAVSRHLSPHRFSVSLDEGRVWVQFPPGCCGQVRMALDRCGFTYRPGRRPTTNPSSDVQFFVLTGRVDGPVVTRCYGSPIQFTEANRGRCMNTFRHVPDGSLPLCHVHRKKR